MYSRELKLPDHIFSRNDGTVSIRERGSADEMSLRLPASTRLIERKSATRYLGFLASAVFAVYFASMFMDSLFASGMEIGFLVVLIGIPLVLDRILGGRVAIVAYLAAFISFAILRGGLSSGSLRLGLIFFGGGPLDYQGYAIVPASDLIASLIIGLLPFAAMKMLDQVAVRYGVIIGADGNDYTVWVRHLGLVREIMAFLGDPEGRGYPKTADSSNTSI